MFDGINFEHCVARSIQFQHLAIGTDDLHTVRLRLDDRTQAGLTGAQRRLGPLALGEVTNGRNDQYSHLIDDRAQTDFNRKLHTVFAYREQLKADAHRSEFPALDEALAMLDVQGAEAFG